MCYGRAWASLMVCVPKAALIPDGDLTWRVGLGLEAATGLNRRQKEALVDMRHGRTWSNGEYIGSILV